MLYSRGTVFFVLLNRSFMTIVHNFVLPMTGQSLSHSLMLSTYTQGISYISHKSQVLHTHNTMQCYDWIALLNIVFSIFISRYNFNPLKCYGKKKSPWHHLSPLTLAIFPLPLMDSSLAPG